jgi:hypothetical protein
LNLFIERVKSKIAARTRKTDFAGIKTRNFIEEGYKKLKKERGRKDLSLF